MHGIDQLSFRNFGGAARQSDANAKCEAVIAAFSRKTGELACG